MLNMATHESFICKVGIGMPIETEVAGPISNSLAQRIAADCANQAADIVIGAATASTTPGLACESFKKTFHKVLNKAVQGSRVGTLCHAMTQPVRIGL